MAMEIKHLTTQKHDLSTKVVDVACDAIDVACDAIDVVSRLRAENAELKAENERLNNALDKERSETIKYMDELCNAKNEIERLTIDKRNAELRADVADATIAELKAQNAELKQKLHTAEVITDLTEAACMEYRENYKKLAKSQRWRKYPEEKPDDGQVVWAYEADNNRVLTLEYEKTDEGEGFICFPYKQDFYTGVTHWMPYNKPKAPEVK